MKEETLIKALAIRQELDILTTVQDSIKSEYIPDIDDQYLFRLTYISSSMRGSKWHIVDLESMKYIGDILDRHDKEIRKEIADRIAELKKEIEELWR